MKSTLNESGRADLRRVLAQMESSAPLAPDLEPAVALSEPIRHRSTALNALIGVAAVVALILPAAFFFDRSPAEQPDDVPVGAQPPVEPSTTTVTTSPVSVAVDWTWSEFPTSVDAVVVHEGSFIATSREIVLASQDGTNWSEVGRLDAGAVVEEITSFRGSLVARGAVYVDEPDGSRAVTASLWVSADSGVTWDPALPGELVRDVAATPEELVAVGWIEEEPIEERRLLRASVWRSADGQDWELAWTHDAGPQESSQADAAFWDDGLIVIGDRGPNPFTEGAGVMHEAPWEDVVWTGTTATELVLDGTASIAGNFQDMTSTQLGHFASTYSINPAVKESSAIWRSDDALEWSQVDIDAGAWSWNHVAGDDGTLIVTATTHGRTVGSGVWISTNGVDWRPIDTTGLPEMELRSAAVWGDLFVITGISSSETRAGYLITGRLNP